MLALVTVVAGNYFSLLVDRRLLTNLTIIAVNAHKTVFRDSAIFKAATVIVVRLGTLETVNHSGLFSFASSNRTTGTTDIGG